MVKEPLKMCVQVRLPHCLKIQKKSHSFVQNASYIDFRQKHGKCRKHFFKCWHTVYVLCILEESGTTCDL